MYNFLIQNLAQKSKDNIDINIQQKTPDGKIVQAKTPDGKKLPDEKIDSKQDETKLFEAPIDEDLEEIQSFGEKLSEIDGY